VVDHDILNGDQHQEDDRADDVIAADYEAAKGTDHFPGGRCTGIAVEQDQPRRRDVQRQAKERQQEQGSGKRREFPPVVPGKATPSVR
jgi:hypothetical protein